jgi:hypothetical protein
MTKVCQGLNLPCHMGMIPATAGLQAGLRKPGVGFCGGWDEYLRWASEFWPARR